MVDLQFFQLNVTCDMGLVMLVVSLQFGIRTNILECNYVLELKNGIKQHLIQEYQDYKLILWHSDDVKNLFGEQMC